MSQDKQKTKFLSLVEIFRSQAKLLEYAARKIIPGLHAARLQVDKSNLGRGLAIIATVAPGRLSFNYFLGLFITFREGQTIKN